MPDYGLDTLSREDLLGPAKAPAPVAATPTTPKAPAVDYGLGAMSTQDLLGGPVDPTAEAEKAAALFEASFKDPTEEVKRRNLSKSIEKLTGIFTPAPVMDVKDSERAFRLHEADHATRASPRTSAFLSIQENADVAMQDAKTLAQIERVVRGETRALVRGAEIAAKNLPMGLPQIGAWTFDLAAIPPDFLGAGVRTVGLPENMNIFAEMAAGSRRYAKSAREAMDYLTPTPETLIERGVTSGVRSAGMMLALAPAQAMAMSQAVVPGATAAVVRDAAMRVGNAVAGWFGVGTGAEAFTEARGKGKGVIDATTYAIPHGAFEYLFEIAPSRVMAEAIHSAPGLKAFVWDLLKTEVPGEQLTTLSQNFNTWANLNPNKPAADFLAEQPGAMAETFIATLVGAGLQAGTIHTTQRATGYFAQKQEERRIEQQQQLLTDLFDQAKQIKADPVTFQNFMAGVTDNTTVFINAEELRNTLAQNQMDSSILPSLEEQLSQPSVTGDVEIPIGELMTAFAGTPAQEQVVQHARIRQDDLSAAEQAAYGGTEAEFFRKQAAVVMEKQKANEQFTTERAEIEADIVAKLQSLAPLSERPFNTRDFKYQASLLGAFYATAADLMGTTPKQVAALVAPKILGTEAAPAEAGLTQGFSHGNAMLNVGLDVGATDRAQKIDAAFVEAELNKMGVQVLSAKEVEGEYEYEGKAVKELTYVPQLSRPLTEAEVNALAIATGQEAIGHYAGGVGNLWGPNAANWGAFNPAFFKDQEGVTLSDAQKAELGQSQSSRRPTTKRAPEDHLGEVPLTVDYTKIEDDKNEQNMALVAKYPGIRFKARKAAGRVEEFIQHVTNNLLWLHDQVPADIRQRSKLWYDGARAITDRWTKKYGKSDSQIAAVLAIYSPQKDWFMNVSLAERTLDIVQNQQNTPWSAEMSAVADKILADEKFAMLRGAIEGKKLSELKDRLEQAAWLRTFDEAHNNRGHRLVTPEGGFIEFAVSTKGVEKKTGWPGFGTIIKALYVLDDGSPKMIDNALGAEHKVRSFYNNIFHPTSDLGFVTIDTHAVAAGLLRPLSGNSVEVTHNFGRGGAATSAATGMSGTYAYYQEAYRRAAEARGLLPREMQSITWEAVRELYTMGFKHDTAKMAVVDKLWSEYEKGKRDLDSVRAGILNLAGGVEQPAWVGHDSGISPEGWASTYTRELLGDSVPRRAAGTVDGGAGERAAAGVPAADLAQRNVGAVAGPVVGIHYSQQPRTSLASSAFGSGMPGAERERLAAATDPRIKQRVAFYVNTGSGITPESGVGPHAHAATLRNLYDADADALKIWRNSKGDMNAAESAVLDAGFDGYLTRNFGGTGAVVMLGSRSVDVQGIKKEDVSVRAEIPPSAEIPKMKQAAMAIVNNRALPFGRQSVESWKRDLERSDPDTAGLIKWDEIPAGDYYKDQIAAQLWQKTWYYSALQRALEKAPAKVFSTGKATAQWLTANAGKMGIKAAELEATGLTDWLETQGKITQEQVVSFVKQGGVQMTEVELGEIPAITEDDIRDGKRFGAYTVRASDQGDVWVIDHLDPTTRKIREVGEYRSERDVADAINELTEDNQPVKFQQYVLPGGANYKELLITLPPDHGPYEAAQAEFKAVEKAYHNAVVAALSTTGDASTDPEVKRTGALLDAAKAKFAVSTTKVFNSPHYPGTPNILAHLRFNERRDADGKRVLFLEEVQSDWAQKGRKDGFAGSRKVVGYRWDDGKMDWVQVPDEHAEQFGAEKVDAGRDALYDTRAEAEAKLSRVGVPTAPFVTDTQAWTALALKRAIAYAVDNGFDKVAWTTGEQQAERYDLSKHIGMVSYWGGNLAAYDLDRNPVITRTGLTRDDVPNLIGKEAAQRLFNQTPLGEGRNAMYSLEGENLKVGGEGMKGFYDQIVPQVANDVLKKLGGGKVSTINLGQDSGPDIDEENGGAVFEVVHDMSAQPGFDITPAMRDLVSAQGLPLFAGQQEEARRGSFNPLTFDLRLLADANRSTFIHELSHFFMAAYIDMASQPDAPPQLIQFVEDLLGYLFKNVPGGEQVGGEGLGQAERVLTWQEFGAYLQTVEAHDAFGKVSAQEKKQWAAAGEQWRLMALDAKTLKPVDADVDFSRPIIVAPDGDVLDGRHRRAEAVARGRPIAAWVAVDPNLGQKVGAGETAYKAATPGAIPEGRTNLERWNAMTLDQQRAYWEFFAEGFEQYAMTGKAPTKALQSAFSAFAKWMKDIYKTLVTFVRQHGTKPLDAELTQYFDRMLATDEELGAARQERGFQALFKKAAEAGMSPGQFADYMALDDLQKVEAEELLRSRSLRDMKWLSNAKTKAMKELQAEADELRALVQASVEEELASTPIRQAERWLRKGEMVQDGEQIKAAAGHRLDTTILKAMFPEGAIAGQIDFAKLGRGSNALASTTGTQHPDDVAAIFGFRNGEDLVRQLIEMPPFKEEVQHLTDLRMLEEHGDLASPQAIAKAADEAIHNEAHLKMVATEVWALSNRTGSVAMLTRAAKAFAAQLVDNTIVKKLSPSQYANAATRAGKAAVRALAKKEVDKAANEKRTEMVNAAAAKAAYAAEAEVRAIVNRLRKISAYSDKHPATTSREFGVVQAVRAILSDFGIGQHGEKATKYLNTLSEYDPVLGAVLDDVINKLAPEVKPWDQLKVADLRELHAAINGLWTVARDVRSVELAGEKMSLDDARAQLIAKLEETQKTKAPTKAFSLTKAEERNQDFMSFAAKAIRPESWISTKDGLDSYGPWRRLIWNTIDRAELAYNADKTEKLKQLKALLEPIAADMVDVKIDAPELGGTFGAGRTIGYSELLHAILHTGNLSNKTKLLLGRGWGSLNEDGTLDSAKWDAFMARMFAEGRVTKAHMDFVQSTWDLLESMKKGAQEAHKATTGRYFEEIEATPLVTPYGTYRGGYAPAIVDHQLVAEADLRKMQNAAETEVIHSFEKPAGGFTKSRVAGYNQPLELNIAALGRHIDQVLLFSHMSIPVRNVQRVLKGKDLSSALAEQDRAALGSVLAPWLHSAATQTVTEKGKLSYESLSLFTKARSRAGAAIMFANVSNSVQQLTGFFPATLKVSKKELLFAAAKGWYKPRELAASVAEMSPYMQQRLANEVHAMVEEIDHILLNPTRFEKAQDWAIAHSYFLQMAVDTAMSPIIWQAKFNEETARGAAQQEAVDLADAAVRMTQGTNRAIDIAAMEKGSPFYRMFMQFAGYFNTQANLVGEKLAAEALLPRTPAKYGRIGMILAMGWWAPAIATALIVQLFRGGVDDDDQDGEWLDDWLVSTFIGSPIRYAVAAIPVFGTTINAAVNSFNNKPYDDRISMSPAVSLVEGGFRGAQAAYGAIEDPTKAGRAIRDLGTFLSLFTGVPVTPATRAAGFATDVETGKVSPTSGADYARGIITGVASPESKR